MKRKLSLLLAVVMILGSFSFAFAKEDVKPADFLEDKGVLLGDESGDLMLDKPLERRDAVVMLSRLLGVEKEAKAFEEEGLPTWEDNNDKYYNGFLAWAQSNEYFEGHSEEKFGPRDNITVREYAVVLLRALGYKEEAGVWKEVFDTAKKLGLLEGLDKEADDEILRGEMADMTFIALGTKMKGSDKTLAEELGIEMPAPKELKAVVNDTENLKEVVVELSNAKLADAEKLVDENNYRIDKFKVEKVTVDGDNVILLLNKALVKGRSYDLNIRNIDKAINGKYSFKANDNASPKVEEVTVLGEYGIKVTVSEPVDNPKERDFLVDGRNIAMNLETYGRDIILTPYHKSAFPANAETLTVKSLEDFAGYKAALEDFEIEIVKDEVAPEVVDVVVKGNVVEVTFDKDIYEDSVAGYENRRDVGNISYRSGRQTIYTLEEDDDNNYGTKTDTNKAEYVFEDILPRRTEVTIEGVQNHSKVTMEKVTVEAREIKDDLEPEIIDVDVDKKLAEGKATIELEFDKDVYGDFDKLDDHFVLYEREVLKRNISEEGKVDSAAYKVKDGKDVKNIIVVELSGLKENNKDKDYDYILEVSGFEDAHRNRMFRDYVEFELKKDKVFDIDSVKVTGDKDETEIAIKFSQPVDRVRAEDETNYLFRKTETGKPKDVKDLDGEIIVEKDGKIVTLVLPEFEGEGYNYLEILKALRDKDNNKLEGPTVYDLTTGEPVKEEVEPEVVSITYINNKADGTTAAEAQPKDGVLEVVKLTADLKVDIKYTNEGTADKKIAQDSVRVELHDDKGSIFSTDLPAADQTVKPGKDVVLGQIDLTSGTSKISDKAGTYKVVTKLDGKEHVLTVKVLDTENELESLTIAGKAVADVDAIDDPFILPYGVTTDNVAVNAVAKSDSADVKVEKAGTVVTVTVTPEAGKDYAKQYTINLKQQAKVADVTVDTITGGEVTINVTVTDGTNNITGISKDKFELVKVDRAGTEVPAKLTETFVDNGDGTYTLGLNIALVAGDTVVVKVDGVESN